LLLLRGRYFGAFFPGFGEPDGYGLFTAGDFLAAASAFQCPFLFFVQGFFDLVARFFGVFAISIGFIEGTINIRARFGGENVPQWGELFSKTTKTVNGNCTIDKCFHPETSRLMSKSPGIDGIML
jgi:hypothetical protein